MASPKSSKIDELLRDVSLRARIILEGELVSSREANLPLSISSIIEGLESGLYYVTIEGKDIGYWHIILRNKEIIGCVSELEDIIGDECVQRLREKLSSSGSVRINIYKIDEKILGEAVGETPVHELVETPAETTSVEEKETKVSLGFIEYKLQSELTKLGYAVDEVLITPSTRDVAVFIKLNKHSKPPSVAEILYTVAKHICLDIAVPEKLGVEIEHKKRKLYQLDINREKERCLAYGVITDVLREHGLIVTNISIKPGETLIVEINAKPLPHELEYRPEEAAKTIREMLRGLLGKELKVRLKLGFFGKKIEV